MCTFSLDGPRVSRGESKSVRWAHRKGLPEAILAEAAKKDKKAAFATAKKLRQRQRAKERDVNRPLPHQCSVHGVQLELDHITSYCPMC